MGIGYCSGLSRGLNIAQDSFLWGWVQVGRSRCTTEVFQHREQSGLNDRHVQLSGYVYMFFFSRPSRIFIPTSSCEEEWAKMIKSQESAHSIMKRNYTRITSLAKGKLWFRHAWVCSSPFPRHGFSAVAGPSIHAPSLQREMSKVQFVMTLLFSVLCRAENRHQPPWDLGL